MDVDVAAPALRPWAEPPPPQDWDPVSPRAQPAALSKLYSPVTRPLAVDVCVFTVAPHPEDARDALQVVLTRREAPPLRGWWALPGGPLARDESLGDAAARVLAEQTGVQGAHLEQLASFGDPGRDPAG